MDTLNSTMTALFIWINSHLGLIGADYQIPPYFPEIKFVPQKELSQKVCNKPCPVIGWYPTKTQIQGKEILYFIEGIDPINNLCIRTIFLHELVHFWQDYNNAFEDTSDSEKVKFTYKESQATQLEHIYRAHEYKRYRKKHGTYYKPKCCKDIVFGRCVNDPGWIDQLIRKNKK